MREKPLGPWFGVERAAEYLGIAVDTLNKFRSDGGGPLYIKRGRSIRYCYLWLDDWFIARAARSTSEYITLDEQAPDAVPEK